MLRDIMAILLVCAALAQAGAATAAAPLTDVNLPAATQTASSPLACGAPPAGSTPATQANALLVEINRFRLQNGLYPLAYNALLAAATLGHSQDMSQKDFFSHIGSNGSTPTDRVGAAGYDFSSLRENLAGGHENAALIMVEWPLSPLHRSPLVDPALTEAGIGYVHDPNDQGNVRLDGGGIGGPYCFYWTLDAGSRAMIYPVVINHGEATLTSRNVMVTIPGTAGMQVRFANQPEWTGVPWQNSAPAIPYELPPGGGPKTVYGQVLFGGILTIDALPATATLQQSAARLVYLPLMKR